MGNKITNLINFEQVKSLAKDGILIHIMEDTQKVLIVGTL